MGGPLMLAGNPAVQKDIGLEEDGAAKVQKIVDSCREEMMAEMEKAGLGFGGPGQFADLKPEEREAKMREMMEKRMAVMKKMNEKFVPQLKEALPGPQFERLQQIAWQAAGSQSLPEPELAKALELSKEQQEKIVAINREYGSKQREMGPFGRRGRGEGEGPPDFEAMRTKMQELMKERDTKATEVLSKEQQEKYAKLKGKPFDLAQLMPMGPGRRGPAGRPGGAAGRPEKKTE